MNLIVERENTLAELETRITNLRARSQNLESAADIRALERKYEELRHDLFGNLSPWQRVNMARHPKRPLGGDYLAALASFDELHGDRHFRDDPAIVGGFGKLAMPDGTFRRIVAIAQQKGRDVKENVKRNFGMPGPEGYRKAKRLMLLASRLRLPIVTFVDTPGADPGIGSEERAQSEAIAACLTTLAQVRVPVVATIVGEGGSGGALALAMADRVIMPENAVYSVASPEGCAAILWGDAGRAEEAATHLKLTSRDLLGFGIVDEIVPEPLGGAHREGEAFVRRILETVARALVALEAESSEALRAARYEKYRAIGRRHEEIALVSAIS